MRTSLYILPFWLFICKGTVFASEIPAEKDLPFKKIKFQVLDLKTKEPLARGEESITYNDGKITKITEYFSTGKNPSILQSEMATTRLSNLNVLEYRFKNSQTGEMVELTMPTPPDASVVYSAKQGDPPKKSEYKWSERTIIGKTLHHFIVRNWKAIIAGEKPDFDLFVPMKRDQFKFRLRKKGEERYKNKTTHLVSLEPANWAIRALVPRMHFFYAVQDGIPVLLKYEGATTVAIDGDESREVAIDFEYET